MVIEKKDNIDLSGSGTEWVDFDVGVRLEFELEHLLSTVDKYDYKSSESPDYQRSFTLTAETIYDDEDDDDIDNIAIQIVNEPSSLDSFIDLNEINYDTPTGPWN